MEDEFYNRDWYEEEPDFFAEDWKMVDVDELSEEAKATKLRVECNNYREQLDSLMEFVQEELINPYDGRQAGSDVYRRARDLMKKSQEVIDFHDAN